MAAPHFDHALPSASFFNIYNDGATLNANTSGLPTGPCHFVELGHGPSGAKCGCRRFWSKATLGADADQRDWCMCSHHACFHDDIRESSSVGGTLQLPAPENQVGPGQENEKPRSGRDPLSPVQEFSLHIPSLSTLDFNTFNQSSAEALLARLETTGYEPNHDPEHGTLRPMPVAQAQNPPVEQDTSIPDTLSWTNFANNSSNNVNFPLPSQCLLPQTSQETTSTSSVQRHLRPFAGKGLNTLTSAAKQRERFQERIIQNLVATPEGHIPDHLPLGGHATPDTPAPAPSEKQQMPVFEGPSCKEFNQLSEKVMAHSQRLGKLENPSFASNLHDDCHEKHEQTDLRVTELETRVEHMEKVLHDTENSSSFRNEKSQNDESASVVSFTTASTNNNAQSSDQTKEIFSQLQYLRSQISQLQPQLPSFANPWEVEVVFLPFPLRGVWIEASNFPSQRVSDHGEMHAEPTNQLPNTCSAASLPLTLSRLQEWIPQSHVNESCLFPRACAPEKVIDRRLRSRGLIRKVLVKGPDARSVHVAINNAFGDVFYNFAIPQSHGNWLLRHDARFGKYLGLHEPWIPLRKIHKDSRLRFLSPAEMITPALWDVVFLNSGVTMKATTTHRLYVTQPGAYMQDAIAFERGWDWQRIREMPRHYAESNGSFSSGVPEADAKEDCWGWNGRLDEVPIPLASSTKMLRSYHGASRELSSPSQEFYTGQEFPSVSVSRSGHSVRRSISRPPQIRTGSMPPIAQEMMSPATRRRVASTAFDRKSSPMPRPSITVAAVAKRRQTRSPSVRLRNTPRRSTFSPSPAIEAMRGVTPGFYYATPHSNGPYEPSRRGPSVGLGNPYGGDDADNEDRGSATDSYDDTEMTNPEDEDEEYYNREWYGVGCQQEYRPQVVYHLTSNNHQHNSQLNIEHSSQKYHPEDDPWPGLPDHPMSDSENVDPLSAATADENGGNDWEIMDDELDAVSETSSQPSEYPSTQSAWRNNNGVGPTPPNVSDGGHDRQASEGDFQIHEDVDVDARNGTGTVRVVA